MSKRSHRNRKLENLHRKDGFRLFVLFRFGLVWFNRSVGLLLLSLLLLFTYGTKLSLTETLRSCRNPYTLTNTERSNPNKLCISDRMTTIVQHISLIRFHVVASHQRNILPF